MTTSRGFTRITNVGWNGWRRTIPVPSGIITTALASERHLFSTLMDNLPDNIWFKDRERRFVAANRAMLSWTGFEHQSEILGKTDQDITVEIDRYIAWPGQALAYKIGQLKIRELRTLAEKELGPKFDKRKFHDVVLENGAVPLNILESHVKSWIVSQKPLAAQWNQSVRREFSLTHIF